MGVKTGSLSAHITATALLDMYAKCDGECPDDAIRMFDEMHGPNRDAVAWNAILSCFVRHGRAADAIAKFRSMTLEEGIEATGFTLATILKACGCLKARRQGEQVHASLTVSGAARDSVVLGTALVDLYSDCGLIDRAVRVFDRLECRKDTAACCALMSGCVRNARYGEAFAMLRKTETNATALTTAMSACSESWNLQYGKQIHCVSIRRGFARNAILCNALVDMYAKCGAVGAAHSAFDQMAEKNVVSWTSIIQAYGSQGGGAEAVRLFREMERGSVVSPNAATFLSVLSACGHAGLVEEGRECFASMKERHGLDPGPEHYACLIDLLGRGGRIEEAWDVFVGMRGGDGLAPPGPGVYAAMLNALCGGYTDVARGEVVAERLLEMEAENPAGIYTLVSNFYAAVGMWGKVEELRRVMKERCLRKEGGTSWAWVG